MNATQIISTLDQAEAAQRERHAGEVAWLRRVQRRQVARSLGGVALILTSMLGLIENWAWPVVVVTLVVGVVLVVLPTGLRRPRALLLAPATVEQDCTCGLPIHLADPFGFAWVHRDGLSLHLAYGDPLGWTIRVSWAAPADGGHA